MKHDFKYISKKDPEVRKAWTDLTEIIKKVQKLVKKEITFQFNPIGSYQRNMITFDQKSKTGYDFDIDFDIQKSNGLSAKQIRSRIMNALNEVAPKYGYEFAGDSTRVITIKMIDRKKSCILHSCDIAIVNDYSDKNGDMCQEYIHFDKKTHGYMWQEQPNPYYQMLDQIDWIKEQDNSAKLWILVRNLYLEKKNQNDNPDVHSRHILSMTINQISQKYGYYDEYQ